MTHHLLEPRDSWRGRSCCQRRWLPWCWDGQTAKDSATTRVGQSVESALIALAAIFLAHRAYFNNFRQKYRILTCCDKRESYLIVLQQNNVWVCKKCEASLFFATSLPNGSYWISPCLSLALYGSLWLPLWLSLALTATLWHTLALSGSLMLSNFAYTVLDWLSGPLLGSQRRCHADALSPALPNSTIFVIVHCIDCTRITRKYM